MYLPYVPYAAKWYRLKQWQDYIIDARAKLTEPGFDAMDPSLSLSLSPIRETFVSKGNPSSSVPVGDEKRTVCMCRYFHLDAVHEAVYPNAPKRP